jgi:predicted DNA-binding transcriptional regulator YafY
VAGARTAGPALPPIAFTLEEADALLLGLALLDRAAAADDAEAADEEDADEDAEQDPGVALADAARSARARIAAALPPEPAYRPARGDTPLRRAILGAIAAEQALRLDYTDGKGAATARTVWPIALEAGGMLAAWCTLRQDFRHFRLDRMMAAEPTGDACPVRRRVLWAAWLASQDGDGGW